MNLINLFPDQQELMDTMRGEMARRKSILLQSATGSGKTAMAAWMIQRAIQQPRRILFSVPRRDLLMQTSKKFKELKIPHSYIASGFDYNPFSPVYIGMVGTMVNWVKKNKLPKFHMSLFDETHYGDTSLGLVINACKTPWQSNGKEVAPWTIGLSATPWKLNGKGMGMWYDHMIEGKSIRWLIDNKRLSDYKFYYGRSVLELQKIKINGGDYAKGELADFMENEKAIIGDCVNDYQLRCMGRLHIVRCASIKHSQMVAESFRNAGIPAQHVDGETPDDQKLAIFMAFARREILVLTFADLLNFGFDLSQATGLDVCIESCSDLKPSMSLAGQMQFWGRVLRYKPYPAIINDHVNNHKNHQLPCSTREWSLLGREKLEGERAPAVKLCPQCYYAHPPAPACPECGFVYEVMGREVDEMDGELHEMDVAEYNRKLEAMKEDAPITDGFTGLLPATPEEETLEHLIKLAKREGKKNPVSWAAKEMAKMMIDKQGLAL